MGERLVHNFRGMQALIVAGDGGGIDVLEKILRRLGLDVERRPVATGGEQPELDIGRPKGALLFLDGDLDCVASGIEYPARLPQGPVIGLVGVEAPSRLKILMAHGATAFIGKPVYAGSVYTSVFLGLNQYLQRKELEEQVEEFQARRKKRRAVIRAIVSVMTSQAISEDEAYAFLRRDSMRRRLVFEDYCEIYLDDQRRPGSDGRHAG